MVVKTKDEMDLINLIYELKEFSEKDIIDQYIYQNNNSITSNLSKLKDYLYILCDIGTLKYDGDYFKVIPPTERLSYRKFITRVLA